MKMIFNRLIMFAVLVTACLPLTQLHARSSIYSAWNSIYPNSLTDDNIINGTNSNCQLCHENTNGGGSWNSYGWEIAMLLQSGSAINDAIAQAEPVNSDSDGAGSSNLEEINADTQPGWTPGPNIIYAKDGSTTVVEAPAGIGPLDPGAPPVPVISVEPASVNFGTVLVGKSLILNVTITNVGDANLDVNTLSVTGSPDFTLPIIITVFPVYILQPGEWVEVPVTYEPSDAGPDVGEFIITSSDPSNPTLSVPLSGNAEFPPQECAIGSTPTSLNFGDVESGTTAALSVTIGNSGNGDCIISELSINGSTEFNLPAIPTLPVTIPPNGSLDLPVNYLPIDTGLDSASLLITSNDPVLPVLTVALSGNGVLTSVTDIDIRRLQTTKRTSLSRVKDIKIKLVVINTGTVIGSTTVNVTGNQNNVEVYNMTLPVTDLAIGTRETLLFPVYTPDTTGDIMWTATLNDTDPDIDEAFATTRVVP